MNVIGNAGILKTRVGNAGVRREKIQCTDQLVGVVIGEKLVGQDSGQHEPPGQDDEDDDGEDDDDDEHEPPGQGCNYFIESDRQ